MKKVFALRKVFALCITVIMAVTFMCPSVFALSPTDYYDSSIEIAVSGGKSIELIGHVEPTIISVTMPSYIPFDISKSVTTTNKAVSPKIDVVNNSTVPVDIVVDKASVDLSNLPGVTWSTNSSVTSKQVAVGLTEAATAPTDFSGANWLRDGKQNTQLMRLDSRKSSVLYIVGNIGIEVPENQTFTVVPTLVVRKSTY